MLAFKKSLVAIVTLLATLTLSACKDNRSSSPDKVTEEDISTLNEEIDSGSVERIMVDEKTGVEYILLVSDGGITPRIDKDGKPVINQQWLKKHKEKEKQMN